jgi:hypothetical protein
MIRTCRGTVTQLEYSRFQRILYHQYLEARIMQNKKILVTCLSLLLVALALPTMSIPKGHAFHNGNITVELSGILLGVTDPLAGTVNAAQAGSTVTVNVLIQASSVTYQRNVTFGFKGDWMSQYQNASGSTTALLANQIGSATISVAMPSAGGPRSPSHSWTVAVWDGAVNAPNPAPCPTANDPEKANSCQTTSPGTQITVYTSDQFAALQTRLQASTSISRVPSTSNQPTAAGQLAQANTERDLGDQSWINGDYSGAKTHYQNSLTDANAAQATFINLGGGSTNAGIISTILSGAGIAMFGVGGLLAGIGGFFYLRRKPKT